VLVGLVVVIVVIWGLSVLLKRFVTVRGLASSSESLKVLYTLSLTPTRTLYLVRLADRVLLIGSGDGGGLRTLADISDPEEVSAILKDVEYKGNFEMNPFKKRLKTLIGGDEELESQELDKDLGARHRKIQGMMDRLKNTGED
jgi:flagellar biogenesis protein FliO